MRSLGDDDEQWTMEGRDYTTQTVLYCRKEQSAWPGLAVALAAQVVPCEPPPSAVPQGCQ